MTPLGADAGGQLLVEAAEQQSHETERDHEQCRHRDGVQRADRSVVRLDHVRGVLVRHGVRHRVRLRGGLGRLVGRALAGVLHAVAVRVDPVHGVIRADLGVRRRRRRAVRPSRLVAGHVGVRTCVGGRRRRRGAFAVADRLVVPGEDELTWAAIGPRCREGHHAGADGLLARLDLVVLRGRVRVVRAEHEAQVADRACCRHLDLLVRQVDDLTGNHDRAVDAVRSDACVHQWRRELAVHRRLVEEGVTPGRRRLEGHVGLGLGRDSHRGTEVDLVLASRELGLTVVVVGDVRHRDGVERLVVRRLVVNAPAEAVVEGHRCRLLSLGARGADDLEDLALGLDVLQLAAGEHLAVERGLVVAVLQREVPGGVVAVGVGGTEVERARSLSGRTIPALHLELEVAGLSCIEAEALDVELADLGVVVLRAGGRSLLVDLQCAVVAVAGRLRGRCD